MTGSIPEEEEEDQEMYDDVGPMADTAEPEAIDEDIYEELPGLIQTHFITLTISTVTNCMYGWGDLLKVPSIYTSRHLSSFL